eukprot:3996067-Prymnesium_polylepis.1
MKLKKSKSMKLKSGDVALDEADEGDEVALGNVMSVKLTEAEVKDMGGAALPRAERVADGGMIEQMKAELEKLRNEVHCPLPTLCPAPAPTLTLILTPSSGTGPEPNPNPTLRP